MEHAPTLPGDSTTQNFPKAQSKMLAVVEFEEILR